MSIFDTDVAPAVAEARLLHPQDHGFFTVASVGGDGRWKEGHFHMSKLDAVAASLRGNHDTYISQASFATKLRRGFNTKSLRCAFVDLDTYNRPGNESPQALAEQVIQRAMEAGIPGPSYIASSGRGLYAKWVFDNPVNAGLLPNWKLMQKKLVSTYLPMGADPKVIDATRVLRLQETINRKNDQAVELLYQDRTHTFSDLYRQTEHLEILKRTREGKIVKAHAQKDKQHRTETLGDEGLTDLDGLGLYTDLREPAMMARNTLQSLNWARFLDLRDLVIQRGGIRRGTRDNVLFWMVSFLAQARIITPTNFWAEVQALLASFPVSRDFNPLQDGSLTTLFERIKSQFNGDKCFHDGQLHSPIYTPANDTLINMLEIEPEEEAALRTIISASEKTKRADAKAPGRSERRSLRCEAREAAVELQAQGLTNSEIARTLGKNRSTIGRWLTPDAAAGRPYVETRGRRRRPRKTHITTRLTGNGPVRVSDIQAVETHHPAGSFSPEEIRARTKIRKQKRHLCTTRKIWSTEQLHQWLDEQNMCVQRRSQHRSQCTAKASDEQIEAQADQLVADLMERLMRSANKPAAVISNSGPGYLSSSPKTGPPDTFVL